MRMISKNHLGLLAAAILLGGTSLLPAADGKDAKETKTCSLEAGGHAILHFTTPGDASCKNADGSLIVKRNKIEEVEVWVIKNAKTLDEAVKLAPEQIVSEFKNFKAKETKELTVAGGPAKRLTGDGAEADDGDPGHADIVVFKVGSHLFVACTHGETLKPGAQEMMLSMLKSAKAP
ncbi:MAG TPA: hypothetical protein VFE24_08200 [Pirellulales bacterium]|jgi:hypothetical protein|nr:hypothetical protein [Pirellulales bacterium]